MRFIFTLLLFLSVTFGQVNDKNFKEKINGGVVVAVFTSEWQEQELDNKVLKGVDGYQDAEIIYVKSEEAKKKLGRLIWMAKLIVPLKILRERLMIC